MIMAFLAVPAGAAAGPDWWEVNGPAGGSARVFGKFNGGCFSGGEALPMTGPGYQVLRPSRERYYGHPELVRFVQSLAGSARAAGWEGLLVGDIAQPRGGPMRSGHQSHQTGLDVDIWFRAAPNRQLSMEEREDVAPVSMLDGSQWRTNGEFTAREIGLLKIAAESQEVGRIFVHPAIKRTLCKTVVEDRDWIRKIRPWWGHHYHFHVRLRCPAGDTGCVDQDPPPPGDGCDETLEWWFSKEAKKMAEDMQKWPKARKKVPPDALPAQCRVVLTGQ
jgi:penicillin-insensitive murein endopeptidase